MSFPCLYCEKPVYPTGANAVMHPMTKQWQHKDCCPEAVEASSWLAKSQSMKEP